MGMKPSTRPVSIEQVRSLLKKSARDMKDAATPGLSSERKPRALRRDAHSTAFSRRENVRVSVWFEI
jgi:hypothetical protein